MSRARARLEPAAVGSAAGASLVAVLTLGGACGGGDFDPSSKIESVRILASRADKPYARPGETVTVDLLAYDGRRDKSRPLTLSWLPFLCLNPKDDAYYNCFLPASRDGTPPIVQGGVADAGAAGSVGKGPPAAGAGGRPSSGGNGAFGLPPGIDLTPFLPSGPSYRFTMPENAVSAHPPTSASAPYGLVVLFNVACAGHLEILPLGTGPVSVPLGCFDERENRLGADDFVIGITRVYSYAARTNQNPVIAGLTYEMKAVDLSRGVSVPACSATDRKKDCPRHTLAVQVPSSSQEANAGDSDPSSPRREQLYANWYATIGDLDDATLLYDPIKGATPNAGSDFVAPAAPAEGTLFVVVHDNRGGANWLEVPLHVTAE